MIETPVLIISLSRTVAKVKLFEGELALNPKQTCLIHYYVIGKTDNLKVFLIKLNRKKSI